MRFNTLASDYDGTLAHDGIVDDATIRALERLVQSGRKLILVTGRERPDLESIFPRIDLCERVVAENGALLYNPATKEERVLSKPPPPEFVQALRDRGIEDFRVGKSIVATWRPHETVVLQVIQEQGLELQIVFNKEAVMVLPSGVNKSSGLCAALEDLGLSSHNVIAIGDAENDHAFLESCECPIAVANAIASLKEKAVWVTEGERGQGVTEAIGRLLENDLGDLPLLKERGQVRIGSVGDQVVSLPAYGRTVLVCGQSGSGKSSLVIGLVERITDLRYELCLVDPEGDYQNLANFRTLGSDKHAPTVAELEEALKKPGVNAVLNLVGIGTSDRAERFNALISALQAHRLKNGRPHWIVIDEAHHVFPSEWVAGVDESNVDLKNVVLVTVHPEFVSQKLLQKVDTVIVVGREPGTSIEGFARATDRVPPHRGAADLERGQALVWFVNQDKVYEPVQVEPSRTEHDRHKRKYAEGRIEEERVFHFRGPENKMDLRAHNLTIFIEITQGIDDETWRFHLARGDYSNWMATSLKDPDLAGQVEAVERDRSLELPETRRRIVEAIQQKYTAPAK